MKEEVKKYLEKAENSLGAARKLFDNGYFEDTCSKAYYVMYYSAQALLRDADITVKKHSTGSSKSRRAFCENRQN